MPELSVVIVATDNEQRAVLQVLVDGTSVARTVHACASFPGSASDPITRRVRAANPDVTLVDIPTENPPLALRAIELLHQEMPELAIFAIGNLNQPQTIVNAMRAGAREFIERPTNTTDLLEAFVRLTTAQRRVRQEGPRGKVFSVINAKGGNGATTVAVNLAMALQSAHGQSALVDLAPLGHAALHLNLKPVFNVADATRNLHRMDASLLESFMTRHNGGLQLLAGTNVPAAGDPSTAEFVRLFDMLVTHYRYVVVDASSRFDAASRLIASLSETVLLVACTDVASLWSAARVQQYLGEAGSRERVRLVLNRFRKVPGFSESDAEAAVGAKLLWRVPNQYFAVSGAIDRGTPLMEQRNTEIARCFSGLAQELTRNDVDVKRATWSLFKSV
ncbi:MAG TPA: cellulose synthase operon protein YhjQ/BcsQ [Candidatus Sulfotelmatobacter sp.]|jgi:pilus assembly protein CpaE|nr:cellulose synthase operon protein YhjQ/BcsQ [Candidatus Sulfotelmatobacter sp.]